MSVVKSHIDKIIHISRTLKEKGNASSLPHTHEDCLSSYLNSLPFDTLERIHAIMYAGRENESAKALKFDFRNTENGTVNSMTRAIYEKQNCFIDYFNKGLSIVKSEGDIDTF